MKTWMSGFVLAAALAGTAHAAELKADIHQVTAAGTGDSVGTVTITDASGGAMIKTALKGLPAGQHGFHVHENGSCAPGTANNQPVPAGAAGGHFDPAKTGKHEGPEGAGHLGDMPRLQVGADGSAAVTLTAPHIKDVSALKGKAVMIHANGDNYSDQPAPLGGGGGRIACGLLQ